MSVTPTSAPVGVARPNAGGAVVPAGAAADSEFARVLAAVNATIASADPAQLPSVGLGQMVEAFASSTALSAPPPAPETAGIDAALRTAGVDGVGPAGTGASSASGARARVLAAGEEYLGGPYKWGGTTSAGFDCSGFVQRAFADIGVDLPRVSRDQSRAGTEVTGDLVYRTGDCSRPNHIDIYAGEGRMLVEPSTGDVVLYQDITRQLHAIRRVV